jgi:hypothetical protein
MRCVFPSAVKPWQKVLCGIVGVAALGGGLYGSVHALTWSIRLASAGLDKIELPALKPISDKTATKVRDFNPSDSQLFAAQGVFTVALPFGLGAWFSYSMYHDRRWLLDPLIEECTLFYRAIRGTECCNIVRSTARFCVAGPILSVFVIATPVTILGFFFVSYISGKDMIKTWKMRQVKRYEANEAEQEKR